jgi:ribosome-associated toxin RatA of RatAB toxin-antitoxin module
VTLGSNAARRGRFSAIGRSDGKKAVADKTAQTIYIEADPSTVMDVIADIASYPEWVNEYKDCEVLEADPGGYPKTARLVLDAAVLKDTMVLAYDWKQVEAGSVEWTLVSSSLLRALNGAYRLSPKGSGTDVTYELSVDLIIPMIGLLKRKAERRLTDTALKDLKKRAEAE